MVMMASKSDTHDWLVFTTYRTGVIGMVEVSNTSHHGQLIIIITMILQMKIVVQVAHIKIISDTCFAVDSANLSIISILYNSTLTCCSVINSAIVSTRYVLLLKHLSETTALILIMIS